MRTETRAATGESRWPAFGLLLFPFYVLLGAIPNDVYLSNQVDFGYRIALLFPWWTALGVCAGVLGLLVRGRREAHAASVIAFFAGLYLVLSDTLCPVIMPSMISGMLVDPIPEPWRADLLDVSILAACGIVAWAVIRKSPMQGTKFIACLAWVFVLADAGSFLLRLNRESTWRIRKEPFERACGASSAATLPNVYHITMDHFSSLGFMDLLESRGLAGSFDGFTLFPRNRANYEFTTASLASYMTGRMYDGSVPLGSWAHAWRSGGMISALASRGYRVTQYAHEGKTHSDAHRMVWLPFAYRAHLVTLADLWTLRVAPHYLHQEAYRPGKERGVFSRRLSDQVPRGADNLAPSAVKQFETMLAEEPGRRAHGEYVHAHFYLPHDPYVLDCDCRYVVQSDYAMQAGCALKMMSRLTDTLKKLGRYEQSIIVFHGDHGNWEWDAEDADYRPEELTRNIPNLNRRNIRVISGLHRAMLLVKPSEREGVPLEVSDRYTQLLDIPATVYELAGLGLDGGEGMSVFAADFNNGREIHLHDGYSQKNAAGKELIFGVGIFKGRLNHYSYSPEGGWRVYPDVEVRW